MNHQATHRHPTIPLVTIVLVILTIGSVVPSSLAAEPGMAKEEPKSKSLLSTGLIRIQLLSMHNLAVLHASNGNFEESVKLLRRALSLAEASLDPDHLETSLILSTLGDVLKDQHNFEEAYKMLQRALEIQETRPDVSPQQHSATLNRLGNLLSILGKYQDAERILRRALGVDGILPSNDQAKAATLYNLGVVLSRKGEFAQAATELETALKLLKAELGPKHPDLAIVLQRLGALHTSIRDYRKAEDYYRQGLDLSEVANGRDHVGTGYALNNLGYFFIETEQYSTALPYLERALKIWKDRLGSDHGDTLGCILNLGTVYCGLSELEKAKELFRTAAAGFEKKFGPDHATTAYARNNLGEVHRHLGDHAEAERLFQDALQSWNRTLGRTHPQTLTALVNLALVEFEKADFAKASELTKDALTREQELADDVFSFTSEEQRLSFQVSLQTYNLMCNLGEAREIALMVLRRKGAVLDSVLHEQVILGKSFLQAAYRELINLRTSIKRRLREANQSRPRDPTNLAKLSEWQERTRALRTELEELETTLRRESADTTRRRRTAPVTVLKVQEALPEKAALVEFVRYSHFVAKNKGEARYGAIVFPSRGEPVWVLLDTASQIDRKVRTYQKAVHQEMAEEDITSKLRDLYNTVWSPIERVISAETRFVILSPDSLLNLVSFAVLLAPDDRFLSEKYQIAYVSSGRDLVQDELASTNRTVTIFADAAFAELPTTSSMNRTDGNPDFRRNIPTEKVAPLRFSRLPGTAKEAVQVAAIARGRNWEAKVFHGNAASEAQLHATVSPWILHLATHGFFLSETEAQSEGDRGVGGMSVFSSVKGAQPSSSKVADLSVNSNNPMQGSGLALAGAQATLEAWKRGEVPASENDGILFVDEIAGLQLDGTWLVVLSACDSGLGETQVGEGVLGIRRAFLQAGAQNLLVTLWYVGDETTPDFMAEFYKAIAGSGDLVLALTEVQRSWLIKLRKSKGLSFAVRRAGPFILSFRNSLGD